MISKDSHIVNISIEKISKHEHVRDFFPENLIDEIKRVETRPYGGVREAI
jgi:hypothetical protein